MLIDWFGNSLRWGCEVGRKESSLVVLDTKLHKKHAFFLARLYHWVKHCPVSLARCVSPKSSRKGLLDLLTHHNPPQKGIGGRRTPPLGTLFLALGFSLSRTCADSRLFALLALHVGVSKVCHRGADKYDGVHGDSKSGAGI